MYKEELADYRKSALPRDFNANFEEEPETNIIRDHLGHSNDRYNALKLKTNDLTSELQDLVDCHRSYNNNLTSTDGWLKDARESLDSLLQEPIASEPINIQKQIDTLKVCDTSPLVLFWLVCFNVHVCTYMNMLKDDSWFSLLTSALI